MAFYDFPQRFAIRGEPTALALATRNEVLKAREQCISLDNGRIKTGDESTPFNDLLYTGWGYADLTDLINGSFLAYDSTLGYFVPTNGAPNNSITYAALQDVTATARIIGRKTAGSGDPEECTISEVLDFIGSAAQGDILYRGSSSWARLAAGSAGQVLQTNGAGANPSWVNNSGGGVSSGTSNPGGSPSTGQLFFRIDLGWMIFYDGTRWLTCQEFSSGNSMSLNSGTTTSGAILLRMPVETTYQMYLTRYIASTFVQTTNSGVSYWTLGLDRYDQTNTLTSISTAITTQSDTINNWYRKTTSINAALDASARELVVSGSKTGAPGALFFATTLFYRLIVT